MTMRIIRLCRSFYQEHALILFIRRGVLQHFRSDTHYRVNPAEYHNIVNKRLTGNVNDSAQNLRQSIKALLKSNYSYDTSKTLLVRSLSYLLHHSEANNNTM